MDIDELNMKKEYGFSFHVPKKIRVDLTVRGVSLKRSKKRKQSLFERKCINSKRLVPNTRKNRKIVRLSYRAVGYLDNEISDILNHIETTRNGKSFLLGVHTTVRRKTTYSGYFFVPTIPVRLFTCPEPGTELFA